jgi:hypothetical protein
MEPIGAYRTVDGNATVRYSNARHTGLDIANPSTGWAAYDRRGLAWRVSEAEARSLQRQHPADHRQDDRARDEPDAE